VVGWAPVDEALPHDLAEAHMLYAAIRRRQFAACPEGHELARVLVEQVEYTLPGKVLDGFVASLMHHLLDDEVADLLALPATEDERPSGLRRESVAIHLGGDRALVTDRWMGVAAGRRRSRQRQQDGHVGADALARVEHDVATGLAREVAHLREPEAGAAVALAGVEGLEGPGGDLLGHASAGVVDDHARPRSGRHAPGREQITGPDLGVKHAPGAPRTAPRRRCT
jgi:hypothetical protein